MPKMPSTLELVPSINTFWKPSKEVILLEWRS
jgi:hypothetical protein